MYAWIRGSVLIVLLSSLLCGESAAQGRTAAVPPDARILAELRRHNPKVSRLTEFLHVRVGDRKELLLICATEADPYRSRPDRVFLRPRELFSVFLKQTGANPESRALLVEPAGRDGVELRVARGNSSELLIQRFGAMGERQESLALFFDVSTMRLLKRVEYDPIAVTRILTRGGVPRFIAGTLVLHPSGDAEGFVIETPGEAARVLDSLDFREGKHPAGSYRQLVSGRYPVLRFGPGGRFLLKPEGTLEEPSGYQQITEATPKGNRNFRLPRTGWEEFSRSRPKRVRDGYDAVQSRFGGEIGPNQVVGNRLWFGKSFYDAEGSTGIGGFGYFDCETRRFELLSPPEIRDWSVSAILVDGGDVWMATCHRGEYGLSPGPLLQWDISAQILHAYPFDSVVHALTLFRSRLHLATDDGIAILSGTEFRRFAVEMSMDEKPRVVRN